MNRPWMDGGGEFEFSSKREGWQNRSMSHSGNGKPKTTIEMRYKEMKPELMQPAELFVVRWIDWAEALLLTIDDEEVPIAPRPHMECITTLVYFGRAAFTLAGAISPRNHLKQVGDIQRKLRLRGKRWAAIAKKNGY